eukprot:CFRG1085T1
MVVATIPCSFSTISNDDGVTMMKEWWKEDHRPGKDGVELGMRLLNNCPGKFGDTVWDIYEYVFICAMDCADKAAADSCFSKIKERFPASRRWRKLQGIYFEAEGRFDEAEKAYDVYLSEDELNQGILKRKIAIAKVKGDRSGAVEQLNKYLAVFIADYEAWMELVDLYLEESKYELACFCLEEVVLSHPHDDKFFTLYGEIMYAHGKYKTARQLFAKACDINKENVRALYGLFLSAARYAKEESGGDNTEIGMWGRDQLIEQYNEKNTALLPFVNCMLQEWIEE